MAYDEIPVKISDRVGGGKAAPVTGVAANGLKVDNSSQEVVVYFLNDSAGAVVLSITNSPSIENVVDGMVVADKPVASVAVGEVAPLGPWLNLEYGNDDPDAGSIPDGKAVLINYTSGDGGKFFAARKGAL